MKTVNLPLRADHRRRIVLPGPAKPLSCWLPVVATEDEIVLRAYRPAPATRKSPGSLSVMARFPVEGDIEARVSWEGWE